MPTPIASTSARMPVRVPIGGRGPVSGVRRPGAAAMRPSRLIAAFRMTNGRRCAHQREERLRSARAASSPQTPTVDRRRRARAGSAKPRPCTSGFGSSIAATTRAMPASHDRGAHGPVRPMWQHGSSVQYSVAPRARAPAVVERDAPRRAARRRARGSPARPRRRRRRRRRRRPSGSGWCVRGRAPRATSARAM